MYFFIDTRQNPNRVKLVDFLHQVKVQCKARRGIELTINNADKKKKVLYMLEFIKKFRSM